MACRARYPIFFRAAIYVEDTQYFQRVSERLSCADLLSSMTANNYYEVENLINILLGAQSDA